MMRKLVLISLVLGVYGCSAAEDGDVDDNAPGGRTLEGDELVAYLAAPPVEQVQSGFRRMGFLWDATEDGALEVRTSLDGATWSEWAAPTVVTAEDVAHGGHVDAITVGDDGSTSDDPLARYYQLRVGAGHAAPTFIDIEPLLDIPALIDPNESVPDTADADDGDPNLF